MVHSPSSLPGDLIKKIGDWLKSEGFPLEFRTAGLFRSYGFLADQGIYVPGDTDATKREIDVLASVTSGVSDGFIRIAYVAECKWSADKPWVVFTSPTTRMAPSACVAQTISSELGQAIIWTAAGDERLHTLHTFATPLEGGFGGRQAFSKNTDIFYSAVQAAVGNSMSYVAEYKRHNHIKGILPKAAVVAFPIVVIEGDLLLATFDHNEGSFRLSFADAVRVHWRGFPKWDFLATIDLVSIRGLDAYLRDRRKDLDTIVPIFTEAYQNLQAFADTGLRETLKVSSGARGYGRARICRCFTTYPRSFVGSKG